MKTIKVIDLLNKIANGKEVPFEIVYGGITYYFNKENRTYEEDMYESGAIHSLGETLSIDNELNNFVFVKEDTPKEDKKIEKMDFCYEVADEMQNANNERFRDFINEIIDKVNGE